MNKFITTYIIRPFAGRWAKGIALLLLWTVTFIALPAVSGWFLAMCSVAFATANIMFAYIIPATFIRFLALSRTAARYFERVENHKTTLAVQRNLQLRIFQSVARLPYFEKQAGNNSALLENSTHGVDKILNHVLLWILPLTTLVMALSIFYLFLSVFSHGIAVEFLVSSALLLFGIPQLFYHKNRKLYNKLSICREENNRELIQSFRGRIEITKYGLEDNVVGLHEKRLMDIERLENRLQNSSFTLQLIAGLGFSYLAVILFWQSGYTSIDTPMAIGIFFGIIAQAELAEILFSGKSEKSSVRHQIKEIDGIIGHVKNPVETVNVASPMESLSLKNLGATIPETSVHVPDISLNIEKGQFITLFGETGKGKTTLLNSLFYPEYRGGGSIIWNGREELTSLPVPQCIYVTQKAYLLTGTLRENFEGYPDEDIEGVLKTVELEEWYRSLPDGLSTWLGENGEILSGGQRKKLLLAQALLKRPQLLVVDEPTAGIGSRSAIEMFCKIKRQHPDMTILMATHLKDFETISDKAITL